MSLDSLSPPGSSQYDSNTFYVGDGTWDASRNSFLLPNLVGLNLATTQYNGMGNRFREMPGYSNIVIAHGVIAAIIFLLLVPTAIAVLRFYPGRSVVAMKIHVWTQILVVFLLTVVLILGWFAVGPKRSLSNPHHGIGVALYVLVLVQVMGGAIVRRVERKRRKLVSVRTMLHKWFGRAIALLGLAQVPLGLTLYGAAKVWFVLYALVGAAWVILWFVLTHRDESRYARRDNAGYTARGARHDSRYGGSRYGGDSEVIEERREKKGSNFLRNTAIVGGTLAALRAFTKSKKQRDEERITEVDNSVISSRPHSRQSRHSRHSRHTSDSSIGDEKYDIEEPRREHTWRNRLLGAGAGVAAFAGVRRLFGRKDRDEISDISTYSRPPMAVGGRPSRTDVSMVESGHAPFSPADRRRRDDGVDESVYESTVLSSPTRASRPVGRSRLRPRRSGSFSSVSSVESVDRPPGAMSPPPRTGLTRGEGIAATLAGITGIAYLRHKRNEWRDRREQQRMDEIRQHDEDIEADRINRTQRRRPGFGESVVSEHEETSTHGGHPVVSEHGHVNTSIPPLPHSAGMTHSTAGPGYPVGEDGLPIPTGPGPHLSQSNTSRVRFQDELLPAAATAGAAALAANTIAEEKRRRRERATSSPQQVPAVLGTDETSTSTTNGEQTPMQVKVNIHPEHVTVRRIPDAERRRQQQYPRRRPRAESLSDSEVEVAGPGYRRRVRPSATQPIADIPAPPPILPGTRLSGEQARPLATAPARPVYGPGGSRLPGPPVGPPPVPVHAPSSSPYGSSPPPPVHGFVPSATGGYDTTTGTGTDMSAFDDNRRRRRAERAARERLSGGPPPVGGAGGGGVGVRGDYN